MKRPNFVDTAYRSHTMTPRRGGATVRFHQDGKGCPFREGTRPRSGFRQGFPAKIESRLGAAQGVGSSGLANGNRRVRAGGELFWLESPLCPRPCFGRFSVRPHSGTAQRRQASRVLFSGPCRTRAARRVAWAFLRSAYGSTRYQSGNALRRTRRFPIEMMSSGTNGREAAGKRNL
jgi:hypothetical protein